MSYELHDGPEAHGPGEFVRLALEAAGAPYIDVTRRAQSPEQAEAALQQLLGDPQQTQPAWRPPLLRDGGLLIGEVGAILHHLAPELKLVGRSEQARVWTQQIQLTLGSMLARLDAASLPSYMSWFERIVQRNPAGPRHLVGGKLSYADLSLFQLVEGARHALPKACERALAATPGVVQLHARVAALPKVAAYLRSPRRLPFGNEGLFRHDPALDPAL
jgi:glutathione S-transferase